MNPTLSIQNSDNSPQPAPPPEHLLHEVQALLDQLYSSLVAGQQALLAHDLTALNGTTQEQTRLVRELSPLWKQLAVAARSNNSSIACEGLLTATCELRVAAGRVQHQARVNSALLVRFERRLRIWANLLAGPEVAYGISVERSRRLAAMETHKEAACPA